MKKTILTLVLLSGIAGTGCITNIELQKGSSTDQDTLIVGKWVRMEVGKQAKWLDASAIDTRGCRGELRSQDDKMIFRLDRAEDNGFFAIKVPPGKTYTNLGVYCRKAGNMGGLAGAALFKENYHLVYYYGKLVSGGAGIYVIPSMRMNYGVRTNTKPLDVKVVQEGDYDALIQELKKRFPDAKMPANIVRVPAP